MSDTPDFTQAIPIGSVQAEYDYLHTVSCPCGGVFAGRAQTLLHDPATGKPYDRIDGACVKCGAPRQFLFDIGSFLGKHAAGAAAPNKAERGCLLTLKLLAAGCLVGTYFAWKHDSTGLVFVSLLGAVILFLLGREAKKAPPPSPPASS